MPCCAMKKLARIVGRVVRQFDGLSDSVQLDGVLVCPGCVVAERAGGSRSCVGRRPHCFSAPALRRAARRQPSTSSSLSSSTSSSSLSSPTTAAAVAAVNGTDDQRSVVYTEYMFYTFNGPITIAIRARFEYDSTTIRARFSYNTLRGFSCARIRDRFEHSTRISGRRVLHVD